MKRRKRTEGAGFVPLLEEVFQVAKRLPLSAWATYAAGTVPFVLAFLYFWGDMANDAHAWQRLVPWSVVLTALFIVAKVSHSVFGRLVMAHAMDEFDVPRPRLTGILLNQLVIQPSGLIALPICLFLVAPFGWAYAVYQNAAVLDDGRMTVRPLIREAARQAGIRPAQSNYLLWLICPYAVMLAAVFFLAVLPLMRLFTPEWTELLFWLYTVVVTVVLVPLCPFGVIVAVNIAAALAAIPYLANTLLGIDTPFTMSPDGIINPTFFVIVVGLTYLCLDPLIKIAFALRCFYGDSIESGKDLRVKLARISAVLPIAVVVFAGLFVSAPAAAQGPEPSVSALDEAIDETLNDRRFTWREPRQRPEAVENRYVVMIVEALQDAGRWVGDRIAAIRDWLDRLFSRRRDGPAAAGALSDAIAVSAGLLLSALILFLLYLAWRTWRRDKRVEIAATPATPAVPDLEDESTTADALASEEWLNLAAELMSKGEFRLAMRAYFFAGLARLAQLRLIRIASYKSNREYAGELQRISHAREDIVSRFGLGVRIFESVWYGNHALDHADLQRYVESQRWISHCE